MAETFLSLPSKRTLISDNYNSTLSPSSKRSKQPPPQPIPTGHATLRVICHASHVGGFIGKSGSTIKNLQTETKSKIQVLDPFPPGSDHRVIVIIASVDSNKTVKVRRNDSDDVADEEEVQVSALQEAVLRVFEKVLEVSSEAEEVSVTVRVLIGESQAGYVIGKGGKVVEKLKRESGVKIRVLVGDHLPNYVSSPDAIVEIEGNLLAVKRGLLGVCGHLQQFPPGDKTSNKESKPVESTSQPAILDFRVDPPLQRAQLYVTNNSSSPATVMMPLSFEADRHTPVESKPHQHEVVFKILCSNDRVGGVIGKGGSIIRALQEETGAHITIGSSVTGCDERLVTVTSQEDVDTSYSPAQRAVILVFSKYAEAAVKGPDTGSNKVSSVSARLLVHSNQVGCLLGKGGTIVSQMRKTSGANIRIVKGEQVPKCATDDDQLVEITGEFVKTQDALYQVTSRLRNNLFPSNMRSISDSQTNTALAQDAGHHERVRDLTTGVQYSSEASQFINGHSTMRHGHNSMYNHQRLDQSRLAGSLLSDASFHGRVRDIPIDVHHYSAASQSIEGLYTMRQGADSLYNRQNLDHLPLAGSRTSEVALDASRHERVRDLPIGLHHSLANSHYIDGLSTRRQGLDSVYNHQIQDPLPSAGSRTSEMALDAIRNRRVGDLPIGAHHSLATSHSNDGLSTMRQGLDSLYNRQRLDHSPLASEVAPDASRYGRVRDLPMGVHHSFVTSQSNDGLSTVRPGLDSLYNSQRSDHSPLTGPQTSELAMGVNSRRFVNLGRGVAPANDRAELGRPAIVTNTTVEILVPEDAISSVYGENGRNLMRIRQVSGAKVVVNEASHGTRDRTVLISGTPEETQAAQSLLHAFILTGSC